MRDPFAERGYPIELPCRKEPSLYGSFRGKTAIFLGLFLAGKSHLCRALLRDRAIILWLFFPGKNIFTKLFSGKQLFLCGKNSHLYGAFSLKGALGGVYD